MVHTEVARYRPCAIASKKPPPPFLSMVLAELGLSTKAGAPFAGGGSALISAPNDTLVERGRDGKLLACVANKAVTSRVLMFVGLQSGGWLVTIARVGGLGSQGALSLEVIQFPSW